MKDTHATERLEVTNFLVLKEAKFDVKRFTVVMGEQATGKSLLAKLLYFFREGLGDTYHPDFLRKLSESSNYKKSYVESLISRFHTYFPAETWEGTSFAISYVWKDIEINLRHEPKDSLKIEISKTLDDLLRHTHSEMLKVTPDTSFLKYLTMLPSLPVADAYATFIPASRSLLALIQQDAPLFVGAGLSDPFMGSFWRMYNSVKQARDLMGDDKNTNFLIGELAERILSGSYHRHEKRDYIKMSHGIVPLANASSGQQEALPMLIVLIKTFIARRTFFVEEPEAHLFPNAQRLMVQLMAMIYNQGSGFFLTTHSPYILSALDNLIMASNVAQEKKGKRGVAAAVAKIIPKECHVRYEDVGAYTIENGKLVSVLDEESKMINADVIDDVSEEFGAEFDALMALRHGK